MNGKDVAMLAAWCGGSIAISVGVSVWLLASHASGIHEKSTPLAAFTDYRNWAAEMKGLTRGDIAEIKLEIKEIREHMRKIEQELYTFPRGPRGQE